MSASLPLRVAAVGDLHVTASTEGALRPIFAQVNDRADVLVLCGDLTDLGLAVEAEVLVRELQPVKVPILAVMGNHDYEGGSADAVKHVLCEAGVVVLDGTVHVVDDVAFAGVKGFCGGFGRHTLEPWGEPIIKAYVQEAVEETLKLEKALARVRGVPKVAVLHYAPIAGTVAGEPEQIYPFLGSSRLEEPLNRYQVTCAMHGHAHRGSPEGRTLAGIPVYNVAMPLLRRTYADAPPFRVIEVERAVKGEDVAQTPEPRRRKDDRPVEVPRDERAASAER
jgi:Icc-related predicted phosphoesterase